MDIKYEYKKHGRKMLVSAQIFDFPHFYIVFIPEIFSQTSISFRKSIKRSFNSGSFIQLRIYIHSCHLKKIKSINIFLSNSYVNCGHCVFISPFTGLESGKARSSLELTSYMGGGHLLVNLLSKLFFV